MATEAVSHAGAPVLVEFIRVSRFAKKRDTLIEPVTVLFDRAELLYIVDALRDGAFKLDDVSAGIDGKKRLFDIRTVRMDVGETGTTYTVFAAQINGIDSLQLRLERFCPKEGSEGEYGHLRLGTDLRL